MGCLPLVWPLAVPSSNGNGSSSRVCKEEKNHVFLRNPAPAVTRILKKEVTGWGPEPRKRWGTSEAARKHASAPLTRLQSSLKELSSAPPPSTDWTGPPGGPEGENGGTKYTDPQEIQLGNLAVGHCTLYSFSHRSILPTVKKTKPRLRRRKANGPKYMS